MVNTTSFICGIILRIDRTSNGKAKLVSFNNPVAQAESFRRSLILNYEMMKGVSIDLKKMGSIVSRINKSGNSQITVFTAWDDEDTMDGVGIMNWSGTKRSTEQFANEICAECDYKAIRHNVGEYGNIKYMQIELQKSLKPISSTVSKLAAQKTSNTVNLLSARVFSRSTRSKLVERR